MSLKNVVYLYTIIILFIPIDKSELCCQTFKADWESLKNHSTPKWYQDAKFGIFIHWGVYSVPAYGNEWYPRAMYEENSDIFNYHRKTYGPQSDFGYKDFIKMFKAENWDPDYWAELFKKSGAKFIVPVAEHHDGFPLYDYSSTIWDASDMGPKRDIIKELGESVRKRGMKYGVSSHRAFNWSYFPRGKDYDTNNPFYWGLYGVSNEIPSGETEELYGYNYIRTSEEFLKDWYLRTVELVDKYQPDLIWFDFIINRTEFEPWLKKFAAYYYNKELSWNKGLVINYKYQAFAEGSAVLDIERGKLKEKSKRTWQTDTSIGKKSWGYINDEEFKTPNELIDQLIDIVSKNGILLLNIGPKADGTIPKEAENILIEIGDWLNINGEAIYSTRTWAIHGEGPTQEFGGAHQESKNITYTSNDVRYLIGNQNFEIPVYAIALDWSEDKFVFPALNLNSKHLSNKINEVRLLGYDGALSWKQTEDGLIIKTPDRKPCEYAYCFSIL